MIPIEIAHFDTYPVYWDTQSSLNKHVLLLGQSGCGKSVEAQKIITQLAENGSTVLCFDMHGTLSDCEIFPNFKDSWDKKLSEINAHGEGIPCPLFSLADHEGNVQDEPFDVLRSLTYIFTNAFRLGTVQQLKMFEILCEVYRTKAYESEGIVSIAHVLSNHTDDISAMLQLRCLPLTARNTFHHSSSLLNKGSINVVRVSQYDPETQHLITELLLAYIWRTALAGQYQTDGVYIFVDEFQNLTACCDSPLSNLLSEGRKMNVHLILATQSLESLRQKPLQDLTMQCGTVLMFHQAKKSLSQMAKIINYENWKPWADLLGKLRQGEFIVIGNYLIGSHPSDEPIVVSAFEHPIPESNSIPRLEVHYRKEEIFRCF